MPVKKTSMRPKVRRGRKVRSPYTRPEYTRKAYLGYRSIRPIMPQEWVTDLKYSVQGQLTSVGAVRTSFQYRTEAYDVDPLLASTAMPGFAELSTIYARWRCLRMSYKVDFANMEAFPLTVFTGFSNSSIASGSITEAMMGNPLWKNKMIGPITGDGVARLTDSKTITQISGTKQALYDDLFTGSTQSATLPTAGTCYCYAALVSPVVLTAAGCIVNVVVTLKLQFYRPATLSA